MEIPKTCLSFNIFLHLQIKMPQLETPTASMFKIIDSSPGKRNKRKSQEPMKRLSTSNNESLDLIKRPKIEQTSDGEDHHKSPSPR